MLKVIPRYNAEKVKADAEVAANQIRRRQHHSNLFAGIAFAASAMSAAIGASYYGSGLHNIDVAVTQNATVIGAAVVAEKLSSKKKIESIEQGFRSKYQARDGESVMRAAKSSDGKPKFVLEKDPHAKRRHSTLMPFVALGIPNLVVGAANLAFMEYKFPLLASLGELGGERNIGFALLALAGIETIGISAHSTLATESTVRRIDNMASEAIDPDLPSSTRHVFTPGILQDQLSWGVRKLAMSKLGSVAGATSSK